jgi:hypothetical protein
VQASLVRGRITCHDAAKFPVLEVQRTFQSSSGTDCGRNTWRRLMDENQLSKVVQGVRFQNGIEIIEMPAHHAA